jgi:hypothetical protein
MMEGEVIRAGFERKYPVPERDAEALLKAVRGLLAPDPHAGVAGAYTVSSLYLDTPDRASYHRERIGKWRLRRYGDADTVFAEYKAKPEPGCVHKRRTEIPLDTCATLPDEAHPAWFLQAIHKNNLMPTRLVSYRRHAFVGELEGEMVRLTLDHAIQARVQTEFCAPGAFVGTPLTEGRILEVKFERVLPTPLKEMLSSLRLLPESFSKYRTAVERA